MGMTLNHNKRYTFRFKSEDGEVVEYLEHVPTRKRSEIIRYYRNSGRGNPLSWVTAL